MARERRIDVWFDGLTLAQIEELARLSGKSALTILQECVNLSNWLFKEKRNGARLMLEGSDRSRREVEFSP